MDVDSTKIRFKLLDGTNYGTWSIRMKALLMNKQVWPAVADPDNAEEGADDRALSYLTLGVADHLLATLDECDTAKEAWDKLEEAYRAASAARRTLLRKTFATLRMDSSEDIIKYIARVKDLRDQLIASGHTPTEDEVTLAALAGLPEQYNMVITVLESAADIPSLDDVVPQLLQAEQRCKTKDTSSYPTERVYFAGGHKNKGDRGCWYCGKTGHIKANCRKKASDEANGVGKHAKESRTYAL